ncbi:MAG: copper uptake system-associated protein [Paracoccaceae bacterium]
MVLPSFPLGRAATGPIRIRAGWGPFPECSQLNQRSSANPDKAHPKGTASMKPLTGLLFALLMSTAVHAHGVTEGDIEVIHPNIPQPAEGSVTAAGYMAISNSGDHTDRLIGVETPVAESAMLHESRVSADGVATMVHVDGIEIPAGDTALLEPGGFHVMLMGLTQTLAEGQMVPGVLVFEHAGRIEIEFMVDPPGGVDHSQMDHGTQADAGHGNATDAPAMTGDDRHDIEAMLKAQFDTPENPLTVAPITLHSDVAIAGWAQGSAGGRAFLRKDDKGWFVELCAGSGLLAMDMLQGLGLSATDAQALLAETQAAEATLGAEAIALFDSFDGLLQIGRDGHSHSN